MSKRLNGFIPFIVRLNEFYNDKIQSNEIKNTFLILLWDRSLFVALGKGEELPGGRGEESEAFSSVTGKLS